MRNNYYDDQYNDRRSRRGQAGDQWNEQGRFRNRSDWDENRETFYGGRDRLDMDYDRDRNDERYQDGNSRYGRSWSDFGGRSDADERNWSENYRYGAGRNGNRYEDDDDYTNRNAGHGRFNGSGRGWYGDYDGHSDAAERGWENRRGERSYSASDRNRDDDRRSRSVDDRRSGSNRGRGWFGESGRHSNASERGWDNRR